MLDQPPWFSNSFIRHELGRTLRAGPNFDRMPSAPESRAGLGGPIECLRRVGALLSDKLVQRMSYEKRIDEMVGHHLAEFQTELTLAQRLAERMKGKGEAPVMPYGYPVGIYRPLHICRTPKVRQFIAHHGGTLSNGVPRILGMELVGQYILGAYNPNRC